MLVHLHVRYFFSLCFVIYGNTDNHLNQMPRIIRKTTVCHMGVGVGVVGGGGGGGGVGGGGGGGWWLGGWVMEVSHFGE